MLELSAFEYGCLFGGDGYQGGEEAEAGMGGTDEQPFLISQHWYDVEKFALPGSSKLKFFRGTAKSFVLKR